MYKSKLRLLGVSALVGAGLMAAGPAEAYNVRLGNVDIQVDSSLSLGASWKMKDTNSAFLAQANGGNDDTRPVVSFFTYGGALAAPMNAAEAAAAASGGTATNIDATVCGYLALCLTVGATEAGALNAAYTGGVAKATRAATLAGDATATQNELDAAAKAAVEALPAANMALPGETNFDASINGDDGWLLFAKIYCFGFCRRQINLNTLFNNRCGHHKNHQQHQHNVNVRHNIDLCINARSCAFW